MGFGAGSASRGLDRVGGRSGEEGESSRLVSGIKPVVIFLFFMIFNDLLLLELLVFILIASLMFSIFFASGSIAVAMVTSNVDLNKEQM